MDIERARREYITKQLRLPQSLSLSPVVDYSNPTPEPKKSKQDEYLESLMRQDRIPQITDAYTMAKEGYGEGGIKGILGAVAGGIGGLAGYLGSSEGNKILAGLSDDPYMAQGLLEQSGQKSQIEQSQREGNERRMKEGMGYMADLEKISQNRISDLFKGIDLYKEGSDMPITDPSEITRIRDIYASTGSLPEGVTSAKEKTAAQYGGMDALKRFQEEYPGSVPESFTAAGVTYKTPYGQEIDKTRSDYMSQGEERRRKAQFYDKIRNFGGLYSADELNKMGVNSDWLVRSGIAQRMQNSDGSWSVMIPKGTEVDRIVGQKTLSQPERDYFTDVSDELELWNQVEDLANELGIGRNNVTDIMKMEFETANTPMGPMSIPARVNLVGQYAQDTKYTPLKRLIQRAFDQYRKRITGAQAGTEEINYLREGFPLLTDRANVFYESISMLKDSLKRGAQGRVNAYRAMGRDVDGIGEYLASRFEDKETPDTPQEQGDPIVKTGTARDGRKVGLTKSGRQVYLD